MTLLSWGPYIHSAQSASPCRDPQISLQMCSTEPDVTQVGRQWSVPCGKQTKPCYHPQCGSASELRRQPQKSCPTSFHAHSATLCTKQTSFRDHSGNTSPLRSCQCTQAVGDIPQEPNLLPLWLAEHHYSCRAAQALTMAQPAHPCQRNWPKNASVATVTHHSQSPSFPIDGNSAFAHC